MCYINNMMQFYLEVWTTQAVIMPLLWWCSGQTVSIAGMTFTPTNWTLQGLYVQVQKVRSVIVSKLRSTLKKVVCYEEIWIQYTVTHKSLQCWECMFTCGFIKIFSNIMKTFRLGEGDNLPKDVPCTPSISCCWFMEFTYFGLTDLHQV